MGTGVGSSTKLGSNLAIFESGAATTSTFPFLGFLRPGFCLSRAFLRNVVKLRSFFFVLFFFVRI